VAAKPPLYATATEPEASEVVLMLTGEGAGGTLCIATPPQPVSKHTNAKNPIVSKCATHSQKEFFQVLFVARFRFSTLIAIDLWSQLLR